MPWKAMKTVVPVSFCIGAAMEMFMIQTGFYDIVTQKEGERMEERIGAEAAARERLKELKIDLPPPPKEL